MDLRTTEPFRSNSRTSFFLTYEPSDWRTFGLVNLRTYEPSDLWAVTKQHRLLVCRMTLETKTHKIVKAETRIKWWKMKEEDCCEEFREEIRRALGEKEELPDDWTTTTKVVRGTARRVLGVSSKQRKEDKETWWWDEEVQESIRKKRLTKRRWDM